MNTGHAKRAMLARRKRWIDWRGRRRSAREFPRCAPMRTLFASSYAEGGLQFLEILNVPVLFLVTFLLLLPANGYRTSNPGTGKHAAR
jgi:hypothetical protein